MSRSRKKNRVHGWTCKETEKKDKQFANRRFRKRLKYMTKLLDERHLDKREVSDAWLFAKDGKAKYLKYNKQFTDRTGLPDYLITMK